MATLVQSAADAATYSFGVGGSHPTLSVTFTSPVSPGNSILVLLAEDGQGLIGSLNVLSITDSPSDSFAVEYENWQPLNSGPGSSLAVAFGTVGGATTVNANLSMAAAIGTQSVTMMMVILEVSNMPSPSVVSTLAHSVFGAEGNDPVIKTLTDSFSTTVSVTFGGTTSIDGGPGVISCLNAFDILSAGSNLMFAWVVDGTPTTPTADHGYSFTHWADFTIGGTIIHVYAPFGTPPASPGLFLPQVNSNFIVTQLPYRSRVGFETVIADVESGPRFAYPRRAVGLTGYPTKPLLEGAMLNYTMITDAEVTTLQTFFNNVRGRWGRFSILDPGGNALLYSEDFTQSYWGKVNCSIGSSSQPDPFGGNLATLISGNGSDSYISGLIGPPNGGLNGFVVNTSIWIKRVDDRVPIFVGVKSSSSVLIGKTWILPANVWTRIEATVVLTDNDAFNFVLGGNSTWSGGDQIYCFGAQVVPMKGSGGYYKSPELYGYHPICRFDVDGFNLKQIEPNRNQLQLPVKELQIL